MEKCDFDAYVNFSMSQMYDEPALFDKIDRLTCDKKQIYTLIRNTCCTLHVRPKYVSSILLYLSFIFASASSSSLFFLSLPLFLQHTRSFSFSFRYSNFQIISAIWYLKKKPHRESHTQINCTCLLHTQTIYFILEDSK